MRFIIVTATLLFLSACSPEEMPEPRQTESEQSVQSRPNVLLIVADDLGYAELGAYGGEIDTPAIDSLAETGIRYTSFYAHSNCSPTRAMLFSGMDSHLAGLGAMHRFEGPNQKGQPGYEGYLNQRTVSLGKLLQDAGYKTYMSGKWHLGETVQTLPAAKGFDRYFAQTKGGPPGGHFNLNGAGPDATGVYFENGVDRTGASVPDNFFSSNFYTTKLIEYLDAGKSLDSPFFAYLAFSAPHTPLQAPESHIDLYQNEYGEGYDVIRQRRFERMQQLGLVSKQVTLANQAPGVMPWDELSVEQQKNLARRMEVYAGAIDNMDDNVARLLDYLRKTNQFDNTLILFMSDNGAAGFDGWESKSLVRKYNAADNSLANLGRDGSMMFYGPGWASAGSTPFYLFKRHMAEGGIRVPFIVSGKGVKQTGTISDHVLTVRDVAPTLLDIIGVRYPTENYENREILPQTGLSFAAQLAGVEAKTHSETEIFGWELFKRRSIRKGDWKALLLDPPFGSNQWQLFNLNVDPGETTDLARQEPEKLAEMVAAWNVYASESNVIISNGPLRWP